MTDSTPTVKSEPKSATISWRTVNQSGATSSSFDVATWTDSAIGYKNPSWKWRVARNLPATTPLTGERRTVVINEGEFGGGWYVSDTHIPANYRELIGRGHHSPAIIFGGNPDGISDNEADQQALGSFWRACVSARNAVQSGTMLGELRETIRMVRGRGESMMHLFTNWNQHLRRSKRRYRKREDRRKEAADAWLEFSFGWAPLAADVKGALSVWSEPRREVRRANGNGKSQAVGMLSDGADFSIGPIICRHDIVKATTRAEVRYKGCIAGETVGVGGKMDRLGLLPSDFVPTLYELLPWSFLLDYVSNVGDIVNSLCFPRGLIKWINKSTRLSTIREVSCVFNRPSDSASVKRNTTFTRATPSGYVSTRTIIRRVNVEPGTLPSQNLRLEIPGAGTKWVNIGALVAARQYKYWP
jgi:hypothetical protein